MSVAVAASPKTGLRAHAIWALRVLLALAFFAAATAKLLGVPMMVEEFDLIGFGQWFRYVTAVVEIIGRIGMLVPGFAGPAGVWIGVTMACATLLSWRPRRINLLDAAARRMIQGPRPSSAAILPSRRARSTGLVS